MAKKMPLPGKHRFPRATQFPSIRDVTAKCKSLGLDLTAEEPGQESSRQLTDWYVEKFCSANKLKPTTVQE